MSSGSFDMRLGAAAIAGLALIGAALFADSVDDRMDSKELMDEMRDRQALIEEHSPVRSEPVSSPQPAEKVDVAEVRADDDDLIDSAEGYDPSGIDPTGFDPTPESERVAETAETTPAAGEEPQVPEIR
ncbi:MAG: hypothetical protein KDD90_00130 [Sphingomonadaceae bacterium]|jgi:hypothetical protein|nr:hypothetical protein [Sphingomonadaceae bacterium]